MFEALYTEYGPRIYRFCLRLCDSNPADAEDLMQEVFVAAFGSLHRFEGRSSLSTYLYRLAVYQWRRQRSGKPETVEWEEQSERLSATTTDVMQSGLDRMDLTAALAALPEAHRTAFLLVKVEGLTCREAAETLDIPVGTVKYHVYKAVLGLQASLAEGDFPECHTKRKEAVDAV